MSERKFLWAWQLYTLEVLIPKQKGKGWLRVPAGHHSEKRVSELQYAAKCDVWGLDGTLSFQTGYTRDPGEEGQRWRKAFEARVFPLIESGYKCAPGRETDYAELHELMKADWLQ